MRILSIPFLVVACVGCLDACAKEWYVGIAAGRAAFERQVELDFSGGTLVGVGVASVDGRDTAFATTLGVRVHPNVALELAYYDFGKYPFEVVAPGGVVGGSTKVNAYGASLVGILPWDAFDFYARLGYARTTARSNASGAGLSASGSGRRNELLGAIGARWNFAPDVAVFAEYQAHDKAELKAAFAGLLARF